MQSQCKRSVCIGLFLTIAFVTCAAQQAARSAVDGLESFALQLINSSPQQRTELLAARPELVTPGLRKELVRRGNNRLVHSDYTPALEIYRIAEKVAEQIGDKEGLAETSLNIGSVYYFQGQHDRALENYSKAQQLFASLGNSAEVGRSLLGLALTFQVQQKLPQALAHFEQALKEFEAVDDQTEIANALAGIASLQYEQGNYEAATKTFLRLSNLRDDGGNLLRIASAFYMQKDYAQALTYYERALEFAKKDTNEAVAISALTGAANCYYNQRDYDQALEFYNRSLELSENLDDKSGVATQLQNLGNVHRARGDYGSAIQSYLKSLSAAAAAPTQASVPNTLGSIGVVRLLQGDNVQALEYFDKSLQAFEASGDRVGMARLFSYIGNARSIQGQYDLALAAYQKGVELHRSTGDTLNVAHLLLGIGAVYVTQKKFAAGLESYQQALAIYEPLGRKAETADALTKIAAAYRKQDEYAKGLEFANKALSLVHGTQLPAMRSQVLTEVGRLQRGLNQQREALNAFNEAIRIQEALRADASTESETQRDAVLPYLGAMEVLIDQGNYVEAFARAEDAKTQVLREIIHRGSFSITKGMTASEQKDEIRLLRALRSLTLQLSNVQETRPTDTAAIRALRDRVTAARSAYESFRKRLYARHPDLAVYRGQFAPLKFDQTRTLLGRDTAILEYALSEDAVYLFVITNHVKAYALPVKPAEIAQLAGRNLYDVLVKPAEQQIAGKSRLIIIPDGVLWDISFAALQPSQDQYLVDEKTLSYAVSVSALSQMRKRRAVRSASPTVLAFADPVLGDEVVERLKTTYRDLPLRVTTDVSNEIQQLRSIYVKTRSQFYTGASAKKETARTQAATHALIHFATPVFMDQAMPLYSFIALSTNQGGSDDGLLRLSEVINLNSKARMVVLPFSSPVQTPSHYGNVLVAMSWAWFVAGTPSVVLSRWQANSTSEFSSELHRNLRRSTDNAESLRQTMLKLRQSKTAHDWSGFMLVGQP